MATPYDPLQTRKAMHAAVRGNLESRRMIGRVQKSHSNTAKDQYMNSYEPSTPRAAFGLAAVALAIMTFGAMVVVPAKLDSVSVDVVTLASAKAGANGPIEVAITPARVDVIGIREPNVAWALPDATRPCKPES